MSVKASLRIQLTADNIVIAESEDPELWRKVFSVIQRGTGSAPEGLKEDTQDYFLSEDANKPGKAHGKPGTGIKGFAAEIGVSSDEIEGACGPTQVTPFIRLDEHYWEGLKSKTAVRGPSSVSPLALAGTILCVWYTHAGLSGSPTIDQCQAVLNTIGLRDANAARSLRNCTWLQARDKGVLINPAQRSKAIRLIKAYCLRKSPAELEGAEN